MPTTRTTNTPYATSVVTNTGAEINSIASGAQGGTSAAVLDNSLSTALDLEAEVVLVTGTWASNPTGTIELYAVTAPDQTNYATAHPACSEFICSFNVENGSTALKRVVKRNVSLSPVKIKTFIVNKTNQAMPASGCTITFYGHSIQSQ